MKLDELSQELHARGVLLEADGDSIRCRWPQGAMTEELRLAILGHKAQILERLTSNVSTALAWECRCIWGDPLLKQPEWCERCESLGVCPDCGGCRTCWLVRLKIVMGKKRSG
jgi:hypothetical protein